MRRARGQWGGRRDTRMQGEGGIQAFDPARAIEEQEHAEQEDTTEGED